MRSKSEGSSQANRNNEGGVGAVPNLVTHEQNSDIESTTVVPKADDDTTVRPNTIALGIEEKTDSPVQEDNATHQTDFLIPDNSDMESYIDNEIVHHAASNRVEFYKTAPHRTKRGKTQQMHMRNRLKNRLQRQRKNMQTLRKKGQLQYRHRIQRNTQKLNRNQRHASKQKTVNDHKCT